MPNQPTETNPTLEALREGLGVSALLARVERLETELAASRRKETRKAKWYKLCEVMEILKLSDDTVADYLKRGLLKRSSLSRHVRIAAEEVDNFRGVACL